MSQGKKNTNPWECLLFFSKCFPSKRVMSHSFKITSLRNTLAYEILFHLLFTDYNFVRISFIEIYFNITSISSSDNPVQVRGFYCLNKLNDLTYLSYVTSYTQGFERLGNNPISIFVKTLFFTIKIHSFADRLILTFK